MKKIFIIVLQFLPFTFLYPQLSGSLFGTNYSFQKPSIGGSGGNGGGSGGNWSVNSSTSTAPSSTEVITDVYDTVAASAFEKGRKFWNKDWDKAIHFFKKAKAYGRKKDEAYYDKVIRKASGYKEWDKGVEQAKAKSWDKAIEFYKDALKYLPDEKTLKDNIIACSYNKTLGLAEKYYNNGDYINGAVYYNVLWKNFDNGSWVVQERYSKCLSEIEKMKKSEQAHAKFNSRLEEVKKGLPFIRYGW